MYLLWLIPAVYILKDERFYVLTLGFLLISGTRIGCIFIIYCTVYIVHLFAMK